MSLVNLAKVCSHIQNVGRVHQPLTSVPLTRMNLEVFVQLYKAGFISSIQRGGLEGPDEKYTPATPDNISTRRIWVGLKYHNVRPVLKNFRLISKPNNRMIFSPEDLHTFAHGGKIRRLTPPQPAELILVRTKVGNKKVVMNLNQALEKQVGGELLCRAS